MKLMRTRILRLRPIALAGLGLCLAPISLRPATQPPSYATRRFQAVVRGILAQPEAARADWGIEVIDQETGQTLYTLNANHYFTPASNAKLFTAVLALAKLGPQYRWRTTLETPGTIDSAGVLEGDLVLVGRGDPDFSNRVFPYGDTDQFDGPPDQPLIDLADQLIAKGVKRIQGSVVADDTYFTYDRYPPGWTIDNLTANYGAPVSAIALDDNVLEVDVAPGRRPGDAPGIQVLPWASFYHFINLAQTGPARSDTNLELDRQPDSFVVTLEGRIAASSQPQKLYIAIEQPARYAAALLKQILVERGVSVTGESEVIRMMPNEGPPRLAARQVLAEHDSPTLGEEVRYMLKVSQNFDAECLLRTVAHVETGVGSTDNGLAVEQGLLRQVGIAKDVALYDGSGLSHYDLVTPHALVMLLRYAGRQGWASIFADALPEAGHDGTLDDRMEHVAASDRVFAKTGTLLHDHSLSGYATTIGGRRLIFAIMVNNIPPDAKFNPIIDAITNAMVEDLGGAARRAPIRTARRVPERRARPQ